MVARILIYDLAFYRKLYHFYNNGKLEKSLLKLERLLRMANSIAVVLEFEEHINARNVEAICGLMTSDAEFVDSLGNRIQGQAKLRSAWDGYFKIVPDYSITHSEIFANGETVAVFGSAQGTFSKDGRLSKENFWKTPAAWRAMVKDGKIALWQVYADNEPIRTLMRKSS
jgi:ketosteroid isomerase-like protein